MELNTTLIGVIILLLIFVPVGYLILNTNGRDKKAKKTLTQLSKAQGLALTKIEVIGNCVIGVDDATQKLAHTTKNHPDLDFKIVPLNEIKECRAKTIKLTDKTLEWVGLELNGKTGRHDIAFYIETDEDGYTRDPFVCLQDAKRWEATLKPLLKAS